MPREKSDPLIVLGVRESRAQGEAAGQRATCIKDTLAIPRDGGRVSTELDRIAEKARKEPSLRFTALAHLLTPEFLKDTWGRMNRRGASGIDGETTRSSSRTWISGVATSSEDSKRTATRRRR